MQPIERAPGTGYTERLTEDGRLWIGADVTAGENYTIPPADPDAEVRFSVTQVTVEVPPDGIPFTDIPGRELFECLRAAGFSMRSRGAQAGLMVVPGYINDSRDCDDGTQKIVLEDGKARVTVPLLNLGARAVQIRQGEGIGCFYHKTGAEELRGSGLVQAVADVIVGITGEYGRDWWYADEHFQRVDKDALDQAAILALALSRDRLRTTPGTPVAVFDQGIRDYRRYLRQQGILVPVEPEEYPIFWITQTVSALTIPAGYNGILNVVRLGEGSAAQTMSLLVKGGQTPNWPIVVEVAMPDGRYIDVSPSYDEPENLVSVDFAHDPMCIFMEVWKDRESPP